MRFGFAHLPSGTASESIDLVTDGEAKGFDAAWLPDQGFYQDPYAMLSVAATRTESIELGLAVTNAFTRHPAVTARAAATVANLAGGRFVLGLGSGNVGEVIEPLGYDPAGIPRRCRETIEIVRGLLDGESVTYDGRFYTVENVSLDFPARVDVPIYLAARGPVMLQLAGEFADGVFVHAVSDASFEYFREYLQEGARRADRSLDDIELVGWGPCVVEDAYRGEFEGMYELFTHQIGSASTEMLERLGMGQGKVETIKEYYADGEVDRLREYLDPEDFDHFVLRGDVETCITELERIRTAGVDRFSVLYFESDIRETRHNVDVFATEVLTALR